VRLLGGLNNLRRIAGAILASILRCSASTVSGLFSTEARAAAPATSPRAAESGPTLRP